MKGDIVLKVIFSFLIPFILLYAFSILFRLDDYGVATILEICVYILISYLLFSIKSQKINAKRILPLKMILGFILSFFLFFLLFLLFNILDLGFKYGLTIN